MEKILEQIKNEEFVRDPEPKKKAVFLSKAFNQTKPRQDWYKVGKVITREHKVKMHGESKHATRRTYKYYEILKGNWEGPSLRQLGKMIKSEYLEYLNARKRLAEELEEVEGPTSSRGGNMLEDVLQEVSHDLNMSSDWLTEWDITGLTTQGHEGISDDDQGCASPRSRDDRRPPHADRRPPHADRRPPHADCRPPYADCQPPSAVTEFNQLE